MFKIKKKISFFILSLMVMPFIYAEEAFVVLNENISLKDAVALIESHGGKATHRFPPDAIIGDIPKNAYQDLIKSRLISSIDFGLTDKEKIKNRGKTANIAADVWNNKIAEKGKPREKDWREGLSWGDPRFGGEAAIENPVKEEIKKEKDKEIKDIFSNNITYSSYSPLAEVAASSSEALSPPPPPKPGYYETSKYLIGDVSVGIIFVESNGSIDSNSEDWTGAEETNVISEIQTGLGWIAAQEPKADITLTYDIHYKTPTGYEPITRSSRTGNEYLVWVNETLRYLGYTNPNIWSKAYDYLNALRNNNGTAWAYSIFVVDDANDADKKFTDGYFAFAYLGGPLVVMTYDNGGWLIGNMDKVIAHESHHTFQAVDEYCSPGYFCCKCSGTYGYLNVTNDHCEAGCQGNDDCGPAYNNDGACGCGGCYTSNCIMESNEWCQTNSTKAQIGWRDNDNDNILQPVDCDDYNGTIYPLASAAMNIDKNTTLCRYTYNFVDGPVIASNDITLDCNGALIIGNKTGKGIYLDSRSGVTIKNCELQNYSIAGVYLMSSSNNYLINNSAATNENYGFYLYSSANNNILINNNAKNNSVGFNLISTVNNTFINNSALNNSYGFGLQESNKTNLTGNLAINNSKGGFELSGNNYDNKLINNNASSNGEYGFSILWYSNNNILKDNDAFNNNYGGFVIYGNTTQNNLTNNTAFDNIGIGFYLYFSSFSNMLSNNTAINNSDGFKISGFNGISYNNTLEYNKAERNRINGFYIGNSTNNIMRYNKISNNSYGFYIYLSNINNTIEYNSIYNNTNYNLYNFQASALAAENNWWGTADLTAIDDSIYDYYDDNAKGVVEYCPLLDAPYPSGINIYCSSFNLSLAAGWNIVSLPLMPKNKTITSVLSSVQGNYSKVFAYSPFDANSWKMHDPNNASVSNLNLIDEKAGFWIKMSNSDILSVQGIMPAATNFILKKGLNIISYPSNAAKPLNETLKNAETDFTAVFSYVDGNWLSYSPNKPPYLNTLKNMTPGYGYWVKVDNDVNWTFNGTFN